MPEAKSWYFSKTIWGSLIAVAATVATAFGLNIDEASQLQLTDAVLQLVTVAGSLFAVLGRLTASSRIA